MEEEEKNKENEQNDSDTKPNIIESEINPSCNTNNSEAFRHMNKEKIKTNEEKFKDSKEQTMEIKSEINNNQNQNVTYPRTKNESLRDSVFNFKDNRKYYLKINRCLTAKFKKMILIIFLIISICFIFISIFDIINSIRKTSFFKENKFLINNLIVFMIQIAYALSLLLFQGITILLEPKENLIFNITSILLISIIIILRTVLVIKNDDKNGTMLFNFICSLCLTLINLGIFLITLKILKMKKNVQQNIDEILNYTDILQATNSKINNKKDNQLMLNNSGVENKSENDNQNDKKKISELVEEPNNNNNRTEAPK